MAYSVLAPLPAKKLKVLGRFSEMDTPGVEKNAFSFWGRCREMEVLSQLPTSMNPQTVFHLVCLPG